MSGPGGARDPATQVAAAVTIVVPAYQVERYLGACLTSLRAQTAWADCRVIVVDDGSTDHTGEIAAAAAAHPQITVISQNNQGPGPGAARNRGLDVVNTEFVMFGDGDDELTPRAVELLRDALQRFRGDLAVGATEQFPQPRLWLWSDYFTAGAVTSVPIDEVPQLVHNAATGNKMFRTSWLRRQGWRFAEGIHHQDTVVVVPALLATDEVVVVGDVVHRYRKRVEGGSIMDGHYSRLDNYWDHLEVIEILASRLNGLSSGRRQLLEQFIARSFQGFCRRAPDVLPDDRLEEFFSRTRAVISRLDTRSIARATRHAGERAAYVTMLEGDLPAFRALSVHLDHLVAHRGDLYLSVPASSARHRALLRTDETRAVAEGLALTSTGLQFDVRIRLAGARNLVLGLNAVVLQVQSSSGSALAHELRIRPGEGIECWGSVELPRYRLRPGRYGLRLSFLTPTGRTARWVRRPQDLGSEVGSGDSRQIGWLPDEALTDSVTGLTYTLGRVGDRAELEVRAAP